MYGYSNSVLTGLVYAILLVLIVLVMYLLRIDWGGVCWRCAQCDAPVRKCKCVEHATSASAEELAEMKQQHEDNLARRTELVQEWKGLDEYDAAGRIRISHELVELKKSEDAYQKLISELAGTDSMRGGRGARGTGRARGGRRHRGYFMRRWGGRGLYWGPYRRGRGYTRRWNWGYPRYGGWWNSYPWYEYYYDPLLSCYDTCYHTDPTYRQDCYAKCRALN